MRLNLDILAAWLPEQWRIKQFGSGLRELTLARPRLYEPGVAIQADTLYLTRAEMLPAAPAGGFVQLCVHRQKASEAISDSRTSHPTAAGRSKPYRGL